MKHILIIALMLFSVVSLGMDGRSARHNPYGCVGNREGRPPLVRRLFGASPAAPRQAHPAVTPDPTLSQEYRGFEFNRISGPEVPLEVLREVFGPQVVVYQNTTAPSAEGPLSEPAGEEDDAGENDSGLGEDSEDSEDSNDSSDGETQYNFFS